MFIHDCSFRSGCLVRHRAHKFTWHNVAWIAESIHLPSLQDENLIDMMKERQTLGHNDGSDTGRGGSLQCCKQYLLSLSVEAGIWFVEYDESRSAIIGSGKAEELLLTTRGLEAFF
ncbi:hypothetical protein AKG11_29630 [Shinella sp. SUS2]|nr:hypothetical protein AKG11_29630 [Shinella sp. SUS2]KOC72219.1 hypothetical protein AKG10_28680 [Shinella sp. GWS1]